MTYRDDVAALRDRIDELAAQVEQLDAEPRLAAVEERLHRAVTAQAELEQRGASLRSTRGLAIAALVGLVAVGAWAYDALDDLGRKVWAAEANAVNAMNAAQQRLVPQAVVPTRIPDFDPVVRPGTVTAVSGDATVAEGEACTVTVIPAATNGELNCQLRVHCGEQRLYGKPGLGYLICGLKEGMVHYGKDEDNTADGGDPRAELDLGKGQVVIADGPDPQYSVTVTLGASQALPTGE